MKILFLLDITRDSSHNSLTLSGIGIVLLRFFLMKSQILESFAQPSIKSSATTLEATMNWDGKIAQSEGWDIFTVEREGETPHLEIQKLDDPASIPELGYAEPKFDYDEDAVAFVADRARTSDYHKRALELANC